MRVDSRFNPTRSSGTLSPRRKFILCFEGHRTEPDYFNGVSSNKRRLGIGELIEIIPLNRFIHDRGQSSPMKVLCLAEQFIDYLQNGSFSKELFIGCVIDSLMRSSKDAMGSAEIDPVSYSARLENMLVDKALIDDQGMVCNIDAAIGFVHNLIAMEFGERCSDRLVFHPPHRIDLEDYDRICLIVDRDSHSNSPQQIDEFIRGCRDRGFEPYITNPCFEFWLLLHYEDMKTYGEKEIRLNDKVDGRTFMEHLLEQRLRVYSKKRLDFHLFQHRIDEAVANCELYCNQVSCLKKDVGSNLGHLIESLRE